jgi:peroxin-6
MGSPLLLRNISGETSTSAVTLISLHASPFGSFNPTIPVAKTVTVARIASPFSTDRNYQLLFLRALKRHFSGIKRLVKQGDMIAVGIDTDTFHRKQEVDIKLDDLGDATDLDVFETS